MRINEARRQLAELRASEIADLERHEKAGTNFDQAEIENDKKRANQIGALITEIQALEGIQKRAQEARAAMAANAGRDGGSRPSFEGEPEKRVSAIFDRYLRGEIGVNAAEMEMRAIQSSGVFTAGGALVAPMEVSREIIKGVDNLLFIRQLATKLQLTSAESLGVPTIETDPDDADKVSESQTGSTTTVGFGTRELKPQAISKEIQVSNKLIRLAPNAEGIIKERMTYKFAVTQEKQFMTGTGIGESLGVLTASTQGVSTARDISLGGATFGTNYDKLYDLQASMKAPYQRSMVYVTHRNHLNTIRKLKDSQNRYLLDINTANDGGIVQLLNRPVYLSEYFTTATTAGSYGLLVGDFKYYWIAEALNLSIQTLYELLARSNAIGFIGRMEFDGMPVLEEAFGRLVFA